MVIPVKLYELLAWCKNIEKTLFCENRDSGYRQFDRPYSVRHISTSKLMRDEVLGLYNGYQLKIEQLLIWRLSMMNRSCFFCGYFKMSVKL